MTSTNGRQSALVLSGGGARAAYQAGALRAIAEWFPAGSASPFSIVCGTSAGALNAAVLAAGSRDFAGAGERLCGIWSRVGIGDVYRANAPGLARSAWSLVRTALRGGGNGRGAGLLDNAPLAALLAREVDFPSIGENVRAGVLDALAITASSYRSGLSVSFFAGAAHVQEWQRSQRIGVRAEISVPHLMASSAIPFVRPARTATIGCESRRKEAEPT